MAMINIKEYHKKLVEGIKQVIESESFRELIEFSTKFKNYSFGNTLMIWTQRKDANHVAGMIAWNSLGRKVNKGERGITIFAPIFKKVKKKDAETGTEEGAEIERSRPIGFRAVRVWDVTQTTGKPVPELKIETPVMDGDREELYLKIVLASPVSVGYEEIKSGANGYYMPKEQKIVIAKNLKAEQRSKTLLHELAHHLTINGSDEKESKKLDRSTGEVIAEGAAFIASAHFGLDSAGYSFPNETSFRVIVDIGYNNSAARH
ncbi:MAG: ArdC family protein [Thermodesulfobacteriota bacterium]